MWINVVMEFWVKMAWCWEADVEGIVIALLEVCFSSSYHFFFSLDLDGGWWLTWWQREDGKGVEEMWEERKMEYPELDTKVSFASSDRSDLAMKWEMRED